MERTLVLIKPDALKRGIAGEIISRFEKVGLKIVGCKMTKVDADFAQQHYPVTKEWYLKVGNNTLADCEKYGIDVMSNLGTADPLAIGKLVWKWNIDYLTSGPVIALVLEGPNAIENVRMIVGPTVPTNAPPGTIRGDFSLDSAVSANAIGRAIFNLVHASSSPEDAKREIKMWFDDNELWEYKRLEEYLYGEQI